MLKEIAVGVIVALIVAIVTLIVEDFFNQQEDRESDYPIYLIDVAHVVEELDHIVAM